MEKILEVLKTMKGEKLTSEQIATLAELEVKVVKSELRKLVKQKPAGFAHYDLNRGHKQKYWYQFSF